MSVPLPLPVFRCASREGLPIFRFDLGSRAIFYVPSIHPATVIEASDADAFETALARWGRHSCLPVLTQADKNVCPTVSQRDFDPRAEKLRTQAREIRDRAELRFEQPFAPECLTLLLANTCNMGCPYCHTSANSSPPRRLAEGAMRAAAETVAGVCRSKNLPLTTVFHGGGEPTLYPELLEAAIGIVRDTAQRFELGTFTYIATNAFVSEELARRMGAWFNLVGISCDGPEDIQSLHRPALNGKPSTPVLERSARILHELGCKVSIRATVSAASVGRLCELVDYFIDRFSPVRIVFEPLYRTGHASSGSLEPPDPDIFVRNLFAARLRAAERNVPVEFPDSVAEELHGPFCHVFRDVLSLTPDGHVTACFDATERRGPESDAYFIGAWNAETRRVDADPSRVAELRRALRPRDPVCAACFNRYHCAQGCPESCPARGELPSGTARCRTALLWSYATILQRCEMLTGLDAAK